MAPAHAGSNPVVHLALKAQINLIGHWKTGTSFVQMAIWYKGNYIALSRRKFEFDSRYGRKIYLRKDMLLMVDLMDEALECAKNPKYVKRWFRNALEDTLGFVERNNVFRNYLKTYPEFSDMLKEQWGLYKNW